MNFQTLNLLLKCNKEYSHKKLRLEDLSDTECMICSYIFCNDKCSQEDVSVNLKIDKTTVGKALLSLEKKDCVLRVKDDKDRRINRLSLTKMGSTKIKRLLDLHDNWLNEVLTVLSEEEREQFEDYCNRLLLKAEQLISNNK